jgi:hypothetical protein
LENRNPCRDHNAAVGSLNPATIAGSSPMCFRLSNKIPDPGKTLTLLKDNRYILTVCEFGSKVGCMWSVKAT